MLFRGKYRVESIRLRGFDYSAAGSYFVTITTKNRIRIFGEIIDGSMILSDAGSIVAEEWMKTGMLRMNVTLDRFQVMPDHFHGIVMIHESQSAAESGVIPFVDWERSMVVDQAPSRRISVGSNPVETDGRPSPPGTSRSQQSTGPVPNRFGPQRNNLPSIIRGFKAASSKRIHAAGDLRFRWQDGYWDRIIRDECELFRIRQYIEDNPRKWSNQS